MNIDYEQLKGSLDLNDVDLVSPESILNDVAEEIKAITSGYVTGRVTPYDGPIESYGTANALSAITVAVASPRFEHDIQDDLGRIGYGYSQFEFCLSSPNLPNYVYRALFMSYGIGGYPVKIVLDEGIARTILSGNRYTITAGNRKEFESILNSIVTSQKMVEIIQELINAAKIAQANGADAT